MCVNVDPLDTYRMEFLGPRFNNLLGFLFELFEMFEMLQQSRLYRGGLYISYTCQQHKSHRVH